MPTRTSLPRLPGADHTRLFLQQGYEFIGRGCDRFGQDMFRARLLLRPVVCARGADAAQLIHDPDLFTRRGAVPTTVLHLLQGKDSVNLLDDGPHRHRKALFVSLLMSDQAEHRIVTLFEQEWRQAVPRWQAREAVSLQHEAGLVLVRTACRWIGLDLPPGDAERLHADLATMIEAAGRFRPAVADLLLRRHRLDRWLREQVCRRRAMAAPPDDPLTQVALFRDHEGTLLTPSQAAADLLGLLRPLVTVARYIMWCALALHQHPGWRDRIRGAPEPIQVAFVEEVRRFYPFFPAVAGRARRPFHHKGHDFATGDLMVLDLHASCRHHRTFPRPDDFDPRRAGTWRDQDFRHIPQGAGQAERTHRCPGERLTVALMRRAIGLLTEEMIHTIPEQDLSWPSWRIPAGPKDGFLMSHIRAIG